MYPNLNAEFARYEIPIKDVAETLSLSVEKTRDRLKGRVRLTTEDAKKIRDKHFPNMTLDYLLGEREDRT